MPIPVTCPKCGHKINAPDNLAGKKARCAKCKEVLEIPVAEHLVEVGGEDPAAAAAAPVPKARGAQRRLAAKKQGTSTGKVVVVVIILCAGGVFGYRAFKANNELSKRDVPAAHSASNSTGRSAGGTASTGASGGPSDEIITKIVEGDSTFNNSGKYPDGEPYTDVCVLKVLKIEHGRPLENIGHEGIPVGTTMHPARITWELKRAVTGALLKCYLYNDAREWPDGKNTKRDTGEWLFFQNEYGEWKYQLKDGTILPQQYQ